MQVMKDGGQENGRRVERMKKVKQAATAQEKEEPWRKGKKGATKENGKKSGKGEKDE